MLLCTSACGDSSSSSVKELEVDKKLKENAGSSPAQVVVDGTDFKVGDQKLWINGVNTPWDKWNDFGGGFNFEFWQEHFSKLHEAGCNAARVWIICDGTTGIDISPDGTVNGATDAHWSDLDDLFSLAETYQIYIMATVQSFDCFKDQNANYQAWRDMINDQTKTESFIDNYIVPLVQRYDKNDYLWSVDLCNEPDWIVENDECGKLDWLGLERYYAMASAAIHENSDVLVTVGLGMIKYNSDKQQGNKISDAELQSVMTSEKYDKGYAYVDFYSVHWYSWMQGMWGYPFSESPEDFGLDGSISISLLAGYPDIFVLESAEEDPSLLWEPLAKALDQACEQFVAAREKEGAFLKEDLTGKLQDMLSRVDYLTGRAPEILTEYRTQLLEKMQELLSESGINEERILQEAAIYADRTCIDEELTRLRSHITAMQDTFALTGSIGKKLDFLAQEMGRESNTILSKTADVASKECAIDLKTEVEKVREQVQNIE